MTLSLTAVSALFPSSPDQSGASGILQALYGQAGSTAASQNPILALDQAEANQTADVKATAAQPQMQRVITQFTSAVQNAKTPQQLLSNPAVMNVLLTANGLGDQTAYTALAQKALLSDPNDTQSLVNKLSDTRWKSVAQTYQFATQGLATIQQPQVISTIANAYAEVAWRQSLDAATPGLSNALTFRAEASGITSVDQILGDSVMRTVVTTALGIPAQIAFQPLRAQEQAIRSRLDISQFKNPRFVESFTQRYLIAANQAAASSASASPDLATLATQAPSLIV